MNAARRRRYLFERGDGGRRVVQLPSAVVGHDHAGRPNLHGLPGVLGGDDALEQDRQAGYGLEPLHVLP